MLTNAHSSTHPTYDALSQYWLKYRLTYEGGQEFITEYLQKLSVRESQEDFEQRRLVTYCPAHAKAAINDIKNALFQRAVDIKRTGGPSNFLYAADGTDASGVDRQGNTMNSFIGRLILPEMLTMARAGVWVDKPAQLPRTRADQYTIRPYIYHYRTEDIRNWCFDESNRLVAVLLQDHVFTNDAYGLPTTEVVRYRFAWIDEDGFVKVQFFGNNGEPIDKDGAASETEYSLNIPEIPFVFFEISNSLLTDVADYQIAMLNLASADMSYALKANFPFYTEQYNPNMELQHLLRGGQTLEQTAPGTAANAQQAKTPETRVGISQGRRYPLGTERPGFINPSPEPLRVSMEKQSQLEQEIRRLINLNVSNISPSRSSAESKAFDERGLESGLSYIALELEYGERKIAQIWGYYEHSEPSRIKYPERYSIKSDEERNKEADGIEKSITNSPSLDYKKAAYKEAVILRIGHKISADQLEGILKQIDEAKEIVLNSDQLYLDIENGLVSTATASAIRGYPEGEAEQAAKDHADRLARIAIAQSAGIAKAAPAARGVADASVNPKEGQEEKKESRDTTQDAVVSDKTRGKGRNNNG